MSEELIGLNMNFGNYPDVKLFIEYNPNDGICLPDGKVLPYVKELIEKVKTTKDPLKIVVSSELIINAIRAFICLGDIDHKHVLFVYKHYGLIPNSDGRLMDCPKGFCDYTDRMLSTLLDYVKDWFYVDDTKYFNNDK